MKPVLKAIQLQKSFYNPKQIKILSGLDLLVHPGESVAITGRSGEGKSTLLQILGTLEDPCHGRLEIMGQQVGFFNKSRLRNRHIAFIFQSFHLLEDYTAIENVLMPAKIARKAASKSHGMNLLAKVGLADRAEFPTKLLSGGEKQRVAIARALCNDPDLIFADEPSGNLDRETATLIHDLLIDFSRAGKAVVIVTHNEDLANLCQTRYQLSQGRLGKSEV